MTATGGRRGRRWHPTRAARAVDDQRVPEATHARRAMLHRAALRVVTAAATIVVGSAVLAIALAAGALVAAGPRGGGPRSEHGASPATVAARPAPLVRASAVAALPMPVVRRFALVASVAEGRAVCRGEQRLDLLGQVVAQPAQAVVIIDPALVDLLQTGGAQQLPPQVACGDL